MSAYDPKETFEQDTETVAHWTTVSLSNRNAGLLQSGSPPAPPRPFEDSISSQELVLGLARPGVAALQVAVDPYRPSTIEEVEKQMSDNAVGLIGRAPFARGALFQDERDLVALSQSISATPAQAAIRLAMQLNPRGTVLIGMSNRQHLRENLRALELSPDIVANRLHPKDKTDGRRSV